MKIVVDDRIPFLQGVFEPMGEVVYLPGREINNSHVFNADAILTRTRTKCDAKLLKNSSVKLIATATIGYDHIDTNFCQQHGIKWTNAPGCNSGSVKQYLASIFALLTKYHHINLEGKTLGVIGVGNVGKKTAELGKALGMQVLLNDPPRAKEEGGTNFTTLDQLLKESDIISVHLPLAYEGEDATYRLLNKSCFEKIKPGTIFINSSRGEVVEEKNLRQAHKTGRLSKVILDVWDNEPTINLDFMNEVLIATNHIAGYSADGKALGTAMSVRNISKTFDLGLDNWYPTNLPKPDKTIFNIDCFGKSIHEIFAEAVMNTYNVMNDDKRLRANPYKFEELRGDYPLRREFPCYSIILKNASKEAEALLSLIGFKIQ